MSANTTTTTAAATPLMGGRRRDLAPTVTNLRVVRRGRTTFVADDRRDHAVAVTLADGQTWAEFVAGGWAEGYEYISAQEAPRGGQRVTADLVYGHWCTRDVLAPLVQREARLRAMGL